MSNLSFSAESADSKSWIKKKLIPAVKKYAKPALQIGGILFPPLAPVAAIGSILIK
jgi:hypothetical protein